MAFMGVEFLGGVKGGLGVSEVGRLSGFLLFFRFCFRKYFIEAVVG